MQIQLCEDDGDFHGGTPQLVVLLVKFDNGNTKRIPYPAEKSIAALYQDLRTIEPPIQNSSQIDLQSFKDQIISRVFSSTPAAAVAPPSPLKPILAKTDKSNIIEKEDIVTLIKLNPRDLQFSGMQSPLMVGMDYRVIEVLGGTHPVTQQKMPSGYDVIDDTAPTPERMRVFPDEVQLKRKRVFLGIEKTSAIEEIIPCPACQKNNSLRLEGDSFIGTCDACGVDMAIARIFSTCKNNSCKDNKVSCFDVGGKYEGHCNKCRSVIEVPYA